MKERIELSIRIPSKDDFMGRTCSSDLCGKYFKIPFPLSSHSIWCPYCGIESTISSTHTEEQQRYALEQAENILVEMAHNEINKMLLDVFGHATSTGPVSISYKPGTFQIDPVEPPQETKVDSELDCPECGTSFQVFGIFGFCPSCRSANILIYDANLKIIKLEIEQAEDKNRALRRAYGDLVSTFEHFCRLHSEKLGNSQGHFQDPFDTRRHFRALIGVDILSGVSTEELLTLRRVFAKRHVLTHDRGRIGPKYVTDVPEDKKMLGTIVVLRLDEFEAGANIVRRILGCLVDEVNLKKISNAPY